jgi:hypothetical protein
MKSEQYLNTNNSNPHPKSEVKTIQISRTLLNEYYDASTPPQREYIIKHFKLDGTTTDEAIRGLYAMACPTWKSKIKENHPEYFSTALKKYMVTQSVPATEIWQYKVEAASEEEAIEKVINGEVEHYDYFVNTEVLTNETKIKAQSI